MRGTASGLLLLPKNGACAVQEVLDLKQWQQERLAEMRDVCRERLAPLLRRQRQLLTTLQSVAAEGTAGAPEPTDGASWSHMNQVNQ